ncbi:MAG: heavy metal translocating P-type ATPase [Pseudomonadota bacterium]
MWLELAALSAGVIGYGARRQRRLPQTRAANLPAPRFRVQQLWRDIRDAMQAAGREQLQGEIDPQLQLRLENDRRKAKREQKLALGAMGVAVIGSYVPVLNLFAAAAVLYLARESFKLIRKDFQRGHYLSIYLIGLVMTLGMIATNHMVLAAFTGVIGGFFARIINRLEEVSHHQLVNVFGDRPEQVWVLANGVEMQILFQDLQVGDQVIVRPGEVIPIDGIVGEGEGQVDQHVLTGESQPAEKKAGEDVFAATLLLSGRLLVTVQTTGDATLAAKIGEVLNQTESYKENLTMRGRKIADRFLPVSVGLSAVTLPVLGPNAAIAMMWSELGGIMAPLGSLSVMNYLQILSRHNILVKDGRVFELLRDVDTVVFDKTGTLTLEQPTVSDIRAFGDYSATEVLRYAAIAEHRQPHPVAKAILARAAEERLVLPAPDEANYNLGYGIQVQYAGDVIQVGSARFLQQAEIALPETVQTLQAEADTQGHTLIYVAVNQILAGVLVLQPTIRPEAQAVIEFLQQRDIQLYIISGDHVGPTRSLAQSLGIQHYFADVLPENKADYVTQLKEQGRFVCFVGDGINDAIALKTAQVSLSLRGASSAATDTAQVVMMDGTLQKVPELFRLADDFEHTMQKNLAISFVPGIITIAGIYLLHFGIAISMAIFYLGCFAGLGNILWPLVKYQETLRLPQSTPEPDN